MGNSGGEHLEIEEYGRTDLDTQLNIFSHKSKFPIRKVIIQAIDHYQTNRFCFRTRKLTLNYAPDNPTRFLLSIDAKIYDEREIDDIQNIQMIISNSREDKYKSLLVEVARQIREQAGFEGALLMEFRCSFQSRKSVKDTFFDELPLLKKFSLKWPIVVSPHRLQLNAIVIDDNEEERILDIPVTYDAENSAVVWGGIPFTNVKIGEDETTFNTWRMQLRIHNSVDLYRLIDLKDMVMSGNVEIELPYLLSGILIHHPVNLQTKIKKSTKLAADLSINIDDQFSHKVYSPYQHIQFPNVVFDEMRLSDLLTLLQDMRFQTNPQEIELDDKNITRTNLITATRKEGTGDLRLWILAEGEKYGTKREKTIPGDEIYTTELYSGKTNIYIRGQLKGDTYRVVNVINEIHDRLKMRFKHVNTVE